jgi:hypothetical protein
MVCGSKAFLGFLVLLYPNSETLYDIKHNRSSSRLTIVVPCNIPILHNVFVQFSLHY